MPVLPAPNSARPCLSSCPLPVFPQLWLSQASSSWPSQRTIRLCWHPAQLGTVRGRGCAPWALEEEPPCPREGSSLGQHPLPGALRWWDASQGHGWLATGNSPAVWAKLGGSNGEKSGGCLTPPPQPCKSSPHSPGTGNCFTSSRHPAPCVTNTSSQAFPHGGIQPRDPTAKSPYSPLPQGPACPPCPCDGPALHQALLCAPHLAAEVRRASAKVP